MNSGSYFTNLMSNGISNPDVYAVGRPDDNPLPDPDVYDVVQPDGNPLLDPEVDAAGQPDDNPPPNEITSACAMFKVDDKTYRNFPYMHCWKILKDKPKWMDRRKHTLNLGGKRQKTIDNASPSGAALSLRFGNVDGGQPLESAQERPPGKKEEKQRLRQRASMEAMEYLVAQKKEVDTEKEMKKEERCRKAFALQEKRIRIERERVEIKRELEEYEH
ncbi:hypothetical protein QOZ80_2AG0129640 [Eleusine coracana subsp. coracana]|nr:hypothetical protein QOZ80_2AG0129640 [Eleusine coracana subsp. coracana]